MQYSIVNLSEVKENSDFRIDAEYYHPFFIKNGKTVNNNFKIMDFISDKKIKNIKSNQQNFDYLEISNVFDNSYNTKFIDIKKEKIPDRATYILENNDICISTVRPNLNAVAFIKNHKTTPIVGTSGFCILRTNDKILPEFLYIFSKTNYFINCLIRENKATMYPAVSDSDIKNVNIPILSQPFQQSIASLVNTSYTLRQSADTLYKEAEEILLEELGLKNYQPQNKKCFVKMLSDTQEAGRIDAEYFQPKYEDVIDKIKKYKGGYALLENISEIKKCIEPGSSEYKEDGIPFVRVSNLDKFGLNAKNQQYISEAFYKKNIEHQPQKGEILLSKDGSLGIAYCLYHEPEQMICSGGIVRLIENKIEPLCLALVLNSIICQMQIEKTSGGALIAHWLVDDIKNLIVPLLPQSIQSQISAKIQQSFESREKSKQLLEVAKMAVEIAIEENEEAGLKYIEENK